MIQTSKRIVTTKHANHSYIRILLKRLFTKFHVSLQFYSYISDSQWYTLITIIWAAKRRIMSFFFLKNGERNLVFATNSDFLIPISLKTKVVILWYSVNSAKSKHLSLKYQRWTPLGWKDIGIRKCKFSAKT